MSDALKPWQIISMIFILVAALWYVMQDLRAGQKDYLTIREHQEYANNARTDLARVEAENKNQLSKDTFNNWVKQRTQLTNDIQTRLMERATHGELLAHQSKDKDLLDNLQRQIDQLRDELHYKRPP